MTNKRKEESIKSMLNDKNGLFHEADVENIRSCVERLTFGFIKVERLFKPQDRPDTDWPSFYNSFETVMARIKHSSSHSLCAFASYYINFIHNAVVPALFMKEHEIFWKKYVSEDLACLIYFKPSKLQSCLPRDYYFWMAMYYAAICNGIYFGSGELMDELDFSVQELQSLGPHFFKAAYDCLSRAQFMDIPDIRSIQVYCLMSTCFHAYGSVGLSRSLLLQCIKIARKLKLDAIEPLKAVNFASEIKKRLWYTLCLIDWLDQMDRENYHIGHSSVPMPALITDEILTSAEPCLVQDIPNALVWQHYSSVYYQRVMVEMSQIKKLLWCNHSSLEIIQGWSRMSKLREDTNKFYQKEVSPITDDLLSYDHARFLLFSSLTEELLDLGRKVLAIVGKEVWAENYRSQYIQAAMENLSQASLVVPSYYRRHWIISQHHIYSALTILLDMIMFPDADDLETDRKKLEKVESIFPIFEELKATHLPAKLGLALLPRLCKLVRFVRVDKQEGNIFEFTSLHEFFRDLQLRRDPEQEVVPDLKRCQYFRVTETVDTDLSSVRVQVEQTNDQPGDFVKLLSDDIEVQKSLSKSGWPEILMNVFELSSDPN